MSPSKLHIKSNIEYPNKRIYTEIKNTKANEKFKASERKNRYTTKEHIKVTLSRAE